MPVDPRSCSPARRSGAVKSDALAPHAGALPGGPADTRDEEDTARSTVSDHASEQLRAVALFDDREVRRRLAAACCLGPLPPTA